jgi:hypothetical protein
MKVQQRTDGRRRTRSMESWKHCFDANPHESEFEMTPNRRYTSHTDRCSSIDVPAGFAKSNNPPNDIPVTRGIASNEMRWTGVPQIGANPVTPDAQSATKAPVIKPELRMPWNVRLDVLRQQEESKARRHCAQRLACDAEALFRLENQ